LQLDKEDIYKNQGDFEKVAHTTERERTREGGDERANMGRNKRDRQEMKEEGDLDLHRR